MPLYIVNVDTGFLYAGKTHRCDTVIELEPEAAAEGVANGRLIADNDHKYLSEANLAALEEYRAAKAAAENVAPVVTTSAGIASFAQGAGAVAVDSGITIEDAGAEPTIASATVTITNLIDENSETLAAPVLFGGVVAGFLAPALTLSGVASLEQYQEILRGVTYVNTSSHPTEDVRSIAFQVDDGGGASNVSNLASKDVAVAASSEPTATVIPGVDATTSEEPVEAEQPEPPDRSDILPPVTPRRRP